MTNFKPICLQLQMLQCFLALGLLCLASLLSAMLEIWRIVVQGWGQALEKSQGQRPHMGFTRSSKGRVPFHF